MKRVTFVVVIALAWVCTLMGVLCEISHQPVFALRNWIVVGFCLGAVILGKWLLGWRRYEVGVGGKRHAAGGQEFLWFGCLVACACGFAVSWTVAVAVFLGMIAGSLVWPPATDDETTEFPPVTDAPEEVPDMTQPTGHPDQF